jgi:hypothetical protein
MKVKHIFSGCTSFCQQVDIGFNEQLKDHIRWQWLAWMISEGMIHGTMSLLMRHDVAWWANWAMLEMNEKVQIICNAWLKKGYKLFAMDSPEMITGGGKGTNKQ